MGRASAKRPRKAAEGEAVRSAAAVERGPPAPANAAVRSAAEVQRGKKLSEEFMKRMIRPLTSDELRQREEEREKLLHGTWERFRDNWLFDSIPFEAVTTIPCMRFTDADPYYPYRLQPSHTLQVVSVQVKELTGGLQWPLDIYGFVAVRDRLDRKRVMVFNREREDCQSINKQDSYLRLTGPTRGVVISHDASHLEVLLKVKGLSESEDKDLSKFAMAYRMDSVDPFEHTSKLCTLEMQHYTVPLSVEATIRVRVFEGQWPHGFRGVLNATTAGQKDIQIALLHLNDDELPVDADGFVKLSRRVVCVEDDGRLGVSLFENGVGEEGVVWFAGEKCQRATHYMHVKKFRLWLEVTVAWSLF